MGIGTMAAILMGCAVGFVAGSIYSVTLREVDPGRPRVNELWKLAAWLSGGAAIGTPWLFGGSELY